MGGIFLATSGTKVPGRLPWARSGSSGRISARSRRGCYHLGQAQRGQGRLDIASGLVVFILVAAGEPRLLGGFMPAASIIPVGDAIIVLRRNGPKGDWVDDASGRTSRTARFG